MQTPLQLDIWLTSYKEFDNAKNNMKLDLDCVLEGTRGMLAEVTFDPTGQVR